MAWRVSEPQTSTEVPTGATYIADNFGKIEDVLGATRLAAGTAFPDPIPAGTKMWFYADTAPTGWTLDATPSDELLAIKGGTTYTTGGATAGTWTQPTHALTVAETPAHTHASTLAVSANSGSGASFWCHNSATLTSGSVLGGSATGTAHNHGTTYRPKARVGIICSFDG